MNRLDRLQVCLAADGWHISTLHGSWTASKPILDGTDEDRYFVIVPRSDDVRRETASVGIHSTFHGHDVDVCVHLPATDVMRLMKKTAEVLQAAWHVARMETEDMEKEND